MMLVYSQENILIQFQEENVFVLSIEEPTLFLEYANLLWNQVGTGEGPFVLSEDGEEFKLSKKCEMLISPLNIDINNKRMHTKLLDEIKSIASENLFLDFVEARAAFCQYFEKISILLPYAITYNETFDELSIMKTVDLKLQDADESILQKLLTYITLLQQILSIKLLIFVNLKDYFNDVDLEEIYKCCLYNKINLLVLESRKHKTLNYEKGIIIDKEKCIISY